MLPVQVRVVVDAPPDKVFDYLADATNRPAWISEVIRVEKLSPGPIGLGSSYRLWRKSGGSTNYEVTEFIPNERIVLEARLLGVRMDNFCEVQPAEDGTRVTVGFEIAQATPFSLPLIPLFAIMMLILSPYSRWQMARALRRLTWP